MAPHAEDRTLMGFDEAEAHCLVNRLTKRLIRQYAPFELSELQCLRYRGNDTEILPRLAEIREQDACDQKKTVSKTLPVLRNHFTFE